MLKTLTLNSNYASHLQIRNPANTGLYQWKPLPYSFDFSNTITVDLMADPWPVGHAWAEWQQRNKYNVRLGSCQEYEWRNASASVTSTFTAFYDPLFSLSLNPIIYEGQSGNGYYSNLTTGEVSSVFQLRKDYAYTVQACAPTGYNFLHWSDGDQNNPRDFRINANSTGLYAVFKSSMKSSSSNSFSNNSQRKFVRTTDGNYHQVYESMGYVWYEKSTDNGVTWTIENNGKPLSTNESKSPSIDYNGGSEIAIVWQERYEGTYFKIKLAHYQRPGTQLVFYDIFNSWNGAYPYSNDAMPAIAWRGNKILVVWKDIALAYRYGNADCYGPTVWYTTELGTLITGTDNNSTYPSTYSEGIWEGGTYYNYFHLAWQQSNQIKYCYLKTTGTGINYVSPALTVSSGSGFTSNSKPSIISAGTGARISWIGYRVIEDEGGLEKRITGGLGKVNADGTSEQKVVFVDPSNLSRYWNFGAQVQSTSINKSDACYSIAWGRSNSLPIQFTDSYTLSSISTIGELIGKDVQLSNGAERTTMRAMAFNSNSQPYFFNNKQLYSTNKVNVVEIGSGREGVVYKGSAQFYFAIGDIKVNDQSVKFVEFDDTVSFCSNQRLNEFLLSEPFDLSNNSDFTYSVQYGITDSAAAVNVLDNDDFINFKVELIDDKQGKSLGLFDNITYTKSNVNQYENITYKINTHGIGNKTVRLRLVTENNFDSKYSLTDRYAEESSLPKSSFKQVSFQGSLEVKDYALEQNYPNPFNPKTTINYQIKEDGLVTLKIYDLLGAELKTLVNEEKTKGRYSYNFNGSNLASGVYIYQLKVNDFVSSKKLMLLK